MGWEYHVNGNNMRLEYYDLGIPWIWNGNTKGWEYNDIGIPWDENTRIWEHNSYVGKYDWYGSTMDMGIPCRIPSTICTYNKRKEMGITWTWEYNRSGNFMGTRGPRK